MFSLQLISKTANKKIHTDKPTLRELKEQYAVRLRGIEDKEEVTIKAFEDQEEKLNTAIKNAEMELGLLELEREKHRVK